jgi:hypothetical protein
MMLDGGGQSGVVARVDPADDGIKRFIVRHSCYDPQRRERRHVVVAEFDNEPESDVCMDSARAERPAG